MQLLTSNILQAELSATHTYTKQKPLELNSCERVSVSIKIEKEGFMWWYATTDQRRPTQWNQVGDSTGCQWYSIIFRLSPAVNQTNKLSCCQVHICQHIICDSQKYHDLSREGLWVGICHLICQITIIWNKCIFLLPLFMRPAIIHSPVILFHIFSPLVLEVVSLCDAYRVYKICLAHRLQVQSKPPRQTGWHFKSPVISSP